MGIQLDNTASGQLVIKGPSSGYANLIMPDMSGQTNKLFGLDVSGNFEFKDIPVEYSLPQATDTVLGGVKQGTGVTITSGVISVNISAAGASGSYNDLTDKPTLFDGNYASLTGAPSLATVATSGNYNDLSNKPTIPTVPTSLSSFTNEPGYQTSSDVTSAVNGAINNLIAGAGPAMDTLKEIADIVGPDHTVLEGLVTTVGNKANTADLAAVAFSGNYSDLSGAPSAYSLPTAAAGTLGGVKVGTGLSIDGSGVLSATATEYTLPTAAAGTLGGIKVGSGLSIDGSGVLSATATSYTLPNASDTVLGGIKIGNGLAIDGSGVVTLSTTTSSSGGSAPIVASVTTSSTSSPTVIASYNLPNNAAMIFNADIVVRNGTGDVTVAGGYTLEGVIRRGANAAATTFVGGVLKSIVAEDNSSLDVDAVADTTNGGLSIRVIGTATDTFVWNATVRITYVN